MKNNHIEHENEPNFGHQDAYYANPIYTPPQLLSQAIKFMFLSVLFVSQQALWHLSPSHLHLKGNICSNKTSYPRRRHHCTTGPTHALRATQPRDSWASGAGNSYLSGPIPQLFSCSSQSFCNLLCPIEHACKMTKPHSASPRNGTQTPFA